MTSPTLLRSEFTPATTTTIVLLCMVFGANPVAVKISLAGIGPFTNAAIRFGLAAGVIFLWAKITRRPMKVQKELLTPIAMISLILTAQISLFYFGMTKTNASHAALIANLLPFIVLILSHFIAHGDRITSRKLIGMIMGFSGVVAVLIDREGIRSGFRTGDLIILGAVFLWACRIVFTKKVIADCDPFHLVLYPFMLSVPLFLAGGLILDPVMVTRLDPGIICAVLYQCIIVASLGFVAWNTLLKVYGASSLHSFMFIMPIAGVCFSGILLGEPITPHLLIALLLVVAGLLIIHMKPSNAAQNGLP